MSCVSDGKITVVKTSLHTILKNKDIQQSENKLASRSTNSNNPIYVSINDAIIRIHKITIQLLLFVRTWIVYQYSKKQEIPITDQKFLYGAFTVLTIKDRTTPQPPPNTPIGRLNTFYDQIYSHFGYSKINTTNIAQIMNYVIAEVEKNINTNITTHFFSHLRRFIRDTLNIPHEKSHIQLIFKDFIEDTLESPSQFHQWIQQHRPSILPAQFDKSYPYDIKKNPSKYMIGMIYMAHTREQLGIKSFQFFPIRTSIVPKNICIDTKTLIDLFIEGDKRHYQQNINLYKDAIWSTFFNTNAKVFRRRNYVFDHRIITDGISVSIQLIRKNDNKKELERENEWTRKQALVNIANKPINNQVERIMNCIKDSECSTKVSEETKTTCEKIIRQFLQEEECEPDPEDLIGEQFINEEMTNVRYRRYVQSNRDRVQILPRVLNHIDEEYTEEIKAAIAVEILILRKSLKQLGMTKGQIEDQLKNEQNSIAERVKSGILAKKSQQNVPIYTSKASQHNIPYIDNLTEEQKLAFEIENYALIDPGKCALLTMMDKFGKFFEYTRKYHSHVTKRNAYRNTLQNLRDRLGTTEIEKELTNHNSKSCDYEKFREYVIKKNSVNNRLMAFYTKYPFRKYKWYGYINRQRAYAMLVEKIKEVYGKNVILVYGANLGAVKHK